MLARGRGLAASSPAPVIPSTFPRLQQSSFPCAFLRLHDTILHCSTRQPSTTTQVGKSNLKSQDSKQHSDSDLFPQAPYAKLEGTCFFFLMLTYSEFKIQCTLVLWSKDGEQIAVLII
ncbi:unnamed protein product [Urochloa humidicola]